MGIAVRDQQQIVQQEAARLAKIAQPKYARNIAVYNPTKSDITLLIDLASTRIPGMATPEKVVEIYEHNPECFWALSKIGRDDIAMDWPEGFFAILPLNERGAQAVASGHLKSNDPDLAFIARQWERPAAIYIWCLFAEGGLSAGLSWWANLYQSPKFNGVPVFAKAGTEAGGAFFTRLGFKPGVTWNGVRNDDYVSLHPIRTEPLAQTASISKVMPAYENYARRYGLTPDQNELSCSVVKGLDELTKVMAIRSVAYIGEQNCPYDEEWDGNDLSSTHLLARKGDEPIGTIRLRCFSDFAKVERMTVLPAYRTTRAAFRLETAISELARAMGYKKLIGHAHENLLRFWISRGWKVIEGRDDFVFSDHQCVQIDKDIEPHADAVTFEADPLTLIRPVGRWHVAGPLDHSAERPPVNTSTKHEQKTKSAA